ncbi:MAG: hypothetical protein H6Q19_2090, partial [Bacteroidetes bacterium]|nr:hypothetical protein [Bacteroidota bacterium]
WRRNNKSAALFADNAAGTTATTDSIITAGNDTTKLPKIKGTSDKTSVDYYLNQIPFTAEQRKKSDAEVADAMFNKGLIFKDKLEDFQMAYNTFDEFERRFGNDDRILETLFQRYLMASKEKNELQAEQYRNRILSFPAVFRNTENFRKKYPVSSLLPKFEFLNTLSIGKTATSVDFEKSLSKLVEDFPESDVSAMSKDILALMKQGNLAQKGTTHGELLSKREAAEKTTDKQDVMSFTAEKQGKHRLLLLTDATAEGVNKLLYNLAIFNFSRFMIKDFDFVVGQADATHQGISVTNLESYDEVLWYQKTLKTDLALSGLMDSLKVQQVAISEDNFGKIKSIFTLDEYIAFEKANLIKEKPANIASNTTTATVRKEELKKPQPEIKKTAPVKETVVASVTKPTTEQKNISPAETKITPVVPEQKAVAQQTKQAETTKTETAKTESTGKTPVADSKQQTTPETVKATTEKTPEKPVVVEEKVEWYKNLFAIRLNAEHFVAFYLPPGKFDFVKIQKALDTYNAANYNMMNLKVSLEDPGKDKFIIVGAFPDANVAKSYFLRMLKDPAIIDAFKGVNRRNLVGTKENLNIMVKKDALNTYFEFMREYYLK